MKRAGLAETGDIEQNQWGVAAAVIYYDKNGATPRTDTPRIRRLAMNKTAHPPMVGAPDPELRNSPIFDETSDEFLSLDLEIESGACYFNGESFAIGDYVCSGDELLHCEERGVWVRKGSCRPV
jgi:hypothetical protein